MTYAQLAARSAASDPCWELVECFMNDIFALPNGCLRANPRRKGWAYTCVTFFDREQVDEAHEINIWYPVAKAAQGGDLRATQSRLHAGLRLCSFELLENNIAHVRWASV